MRRRQRPMRIPMSDWRDRLRCACGCGRRAEFVVERGNPACPWVFWVNRKCTRRKLSTLSKPKKDTP